MGRMPTNTTTVSATPELAVGQIWADEFGEFEVVVVGRRSVVISQLDGHGGIIDVERSEFARCTLVEA